MQEKEKTRIPIGEAYAQDPKGMIKDFVGYLVFAPGLAIVGWYLPSELPFDFIMILVWGFFYDCWYRYVYFSFKFGASNHMTKNSGGGPPHTPKEIGDSSEG